jgi:hypothetical protein
MKAIAEKTEGKVPEWLTDAEDHPLVRQIKADKAATRLAERQALAQELAEVRKLREAGHPEEEAAAAAAKHDLEEAQKRLAELGLAAGQAALALTAKRDALKRRDDVLVNKLVETSDPAIAGLQGAFREREQALRSTPTESQVVGSDRDLRRGTKVVEVATNHPARLEALAYVRQGVQTLENWKQRAEVPAEELRKLEEGIPRTDTFTIRTGSTRLWRE